MRRLRALDSNYSLHEHRPGRHCRLFASHRLPARAIAMLRPADVVVLNGRIHTVDARGSTVAALAVERDRFVATGDNDAIRARVGPGTRVIDAAGRTVVPGLIDGHAHVDREGLKGVFPSLGATRSIRDIQDRIAALVRAARPGEWIVTMPIGDPPTYFGVPDNLAEKRYPTRQELDAVAPDNPVYIRPIWGFWRHLPPLVSIANSRALALAGIDRGTDAPCPAVRIDRDASGEPTGIFLEDTMMPIVELTLLAAAPGFTREHRSRTLSESMLAYHRFGTTSVFEEHGVATELLRAYKDARRRGALTMRTAACLSPNWHAAPVDDPAAFAAFVEAWLGWLGEPALGDEWLRVTGVLVDIEPAPDNRVRARALPYTGWAGFNYDTALPRDRAKDFLVACARNDIRVVGIWPNMLPLYEEVDRIVPLAGRRWVLGHISTLTTRDVDAIARLGLVVTSHTNRYVYKEGHLLQQRLGPARENEISPLRALMDAGVPVSLATDNVPVSLFYPFWQATARSSLYTGRPVAPAQALTRAQALRAATINGAMLTFEERDKGSIEAGKLADLAILDGDPLTAPECGLKDIVADLTMVGGQVVWERADPRIPGSGQALRAPD
jgi:predicted amidohydrolase YtcJ